MREDIFPTIDAEEIKKRATKSSLGRFYKQYKKGDFVYTIQKPPFKTESIVAIHIPTKTAFGWRTYFLSWEKMDTKFGEE